MTPSADSTPSTPGKHGAELQACILFVDDDPLILKSMRRLFSDHYLVQTAQSGEEALAILAKGPQPAVAVVDHQMPGMSGIDVLRGLRQDFPDTVRIMLTGQADLPVAMDAVNRGQVFRFLTKPVDVPSLQQMVAESMEAFQQRHEENRLVAQAMALGRADGPGREASALQQLLEARLTSREMDVLRLIGQGRASKEIGPRLGISPRTVDVHRSHILEKLTLHNSTSLVRVAVKAGLV
jgi:DNA-binding NarL/FixJ family response regulator